MQFKEYLLSLERTPVVESAYSLYTGEPLEEGIADFGKALLLSGALAFGSANAAPNKSVDSYHGNGKNYSTVVQKQDYKKAGKKMDKKSKINKQIASMRSQNLAFDVKFHDRVEQIENELIKKNVDPQIAHEKAMQQAMAERTVRK